MKEPGEAVELDRVPRSETSQDSGIAGSTPAGDQISEKVILLEKKHRVPIKTAVKLRYGAIAVSWASVVISLGLGILATVFAWQNNSQSLFSFGLDALLDSVSSMIVLWRFYGGESLYSELKERRACAMIGILFVLSSFVLAGKSIWSLAKEEHTNKIMVALILAGVNAGVCLVLGITKIILGYKLESWALVTDSVITLTGAAMSIFTLIFSELFEHHRNLWFLDDTFGILCSVFLLLYGLRVVWVSLAAEMKSQ